MKTVPYIILSVVGIAVLFVCCTVMTIPSTYNSLVVQQEAVDTAWSQVETQYQRRFDLIPNLTSATQGYLNQEKQIFKDIADARSRYAGAPSNTPEKVQAQSQLEGTLSRLLVIMENYPTLKSDATVAALMDELAGTENRINIARQRYNETAQTYNVAIRSFPVNIFAGMFGFNRKELYESQQGADKAPSVNLNGSNDDKK